MYALSAADAIAPAIQRTRIFLFRPFRWGTFLKLCLVALVTEGLGNFRSQQNAGPHPGHGSVMNAPMPPLMIAGIVAMVMLVILFACWIFYLITRLRFAYFHCLVHNTREIRPGWRLYRPQAIRFFWLNLAVGFCLALLVGLMVSPFAAGLWRLFRQYQETGHADISAILSFIVPLIPIVVLTIVVCILLDVILRDWMLPHFALENATASRAWAAIWDHISREKGQFLACAILRRSCPSSPS